MTFDCCLTLPTCRFVLILLSEDSYMCVFLCGEVETCDEGIQILPLVMLNKQLDTYLTLQMHICIVLPFPLATQWLPMIFCISISDT
jgi:hypothetical protein